MIHAATVIIPLLYHFFPDIGPLSGQQIIMILFFLIGGAFVLADYLRRKNEKVRAVFMWVVSPFIRDIEHEKMTAASSIAISFFLVLLLFPAHIAVPACMLLSIADATSGIVGRWIGKNTWYKNFTIEGSLAFILAGLLLLTIGFPYIPLWKALLVVSICALLEGLLSHLNDNYVIPLSAAMMLLMLEV